MMQLTMEVGFNEFGAVGRGFRREAKKAVRDFGRKILDEAKAAAPKKTGAFAASIYMKTDQVNGYTSAAADAMRRNPEAGVFDDIPPVEDELTVMFAIAVRYGAIVHDGTATRTPHPVLSDAMFRHYDEYAEIIALALDRVLKSEIKARR